MATYFANKVENTKFNVNFNNLITDETNKIVFLDDIVLPSTITGSDIDLVHMATSNNDSSLYIYTDDDTIYTDHAAVDISYNLHNPNPGLAAVINANLNVDDTVSGEVYGINFSRGNGTADIIGMNIGQNINVISQESGGLINVSRGFINLIDHTADFNNPAILNSVLALDNDFIEIGGTTTFKQCNIVLNTGANLDAQLDFEYWNGTAWTTLNLLDGTQGFTQTGSLSITPPGNWTALGGFYNIRIIRRRNNLSTTPILSRVQVSTTANLFWNKDGTLRVNNLELATVSTNNANESILYYNTGTGRFETRDTQQVFNAKYQANLQDLKINDNMLITSSNAEPISFNYTPTSTAGAKLTRFVTSADAGYFIDILNNSTNDLGHAGIRILGNTPGGDTFIHFNNLSQSGWTIGLKDADDTIRFNFSNLLDYLNDDTRTRFSINTLGQSTISCPVVGINQAWVKIRNVGATTSNHSYLHLQTDYNGGAGGGNIFVLYETGGGANWTVGKKHTTNAFNWNYNASANDFLNGVGVMSLTTAGLLTPTSLAINTVSQDNTQPKVLTWNSTTKNIQYREIFPGGQAAFTTSGVGTISIITQGVDVVLNSTNLTTMSASITSTNLSAVASTGTITHNATQNYVQVCVSFSIASATVGMQNFEFDTTAGGVLRSHIADQTLAAGDYKTVSFTRLVSLTNAQTITNFVIRNMSSTDNFNIKNLEISAVILRE